MIDLKALDAKVNFGELQKGIAEARENGGTGEYPDLPVGYYIVTVEKLELGETKDGRPMVKWQFRTVGAVDPSELLDMDIRDKNYDAVKFFENYKGKKKPCIFMNRVIYGTKNDASMIQSVEGWLAKLECDFPTHFESYSQFNDVLLDVAEDVDGLEMLVKYDPNAFNNVSLICVFD